MGALNRAMSTSAPSEYRCHCGRLLARHVGREVLLRCPRCKREVAIDHDAGAEQRCTCGRLLGRRSSSGAMVIRCARCKREHPHSRSGWQASSKPVVAPASR